MVWGAGGAVPPVTDPGFSDEPAGDDDRIRERDERVDDDVLKLEADGLVVGVEAGLLESGEDARVDPLVSPLSERGCRAGGIGDLRLADPEDEDLDEFVEHDPFRDPGPMASQWVRVDHGWDENLELAPDGVDHGRWNGGHECSCERTFLGRNRC